MPQQLLRSIDRAVPQLGDSRHEVANGRQRARFGEISEPRLRAPAVDVAYTPGNELQHRCWSVRHPPHAGVVCTRETGVCGESRSVA